MSLVYSACVLESGFRFWQGALYAVQLYMSRLCTLPGVQGRERENGREMLRQ